jgi:acetyltransferase
MLVRFTQIDYDREMALIAVLESDHQETEVGVCRYIINADGESCEFALAVADEWQHKGIGHKLMFSLMDLARDKGLKRMEGEVLARNHAMMSLVTNLGFDVSASEDDPSIRRVAMRL